MGASPRRLRRGRLRNQRPREIAYIVKVGPPVSETIRMDRRPRPDGSGGLSTRLPETWEECHQVLCEIEGVRAGSRAFTAARAAAQTAEVQNDAYAGFQGPSGKGNKGDKGKGKGKGKGFFSNNMSLT